MRVERDESLRVFPSFRCLRCATCWTLGCLYYNYHPDPWLNLQISVREITRRISRRLAGRLANRWQAKIIWRTIIVNMYRRSRPKWSMDQRRFFARNAARDTKRRKKRKKKRKEKADVQTWMESPKASRRETRCHRPDRNVRRRSRSDRRRNVMNVVVLRNYTAPSVNLSKD